jgi:drug/metabolite transporter (DMT)-like permease
VNDSAPGHGRTEVVGGALVASSAILFGIVVVLGKVAMGEGLPVFSTLAFRYAASALCLVPILLLARRPLLPARGERRVVFALGAAGYAVESSFFFGALQHGTAAAVTLLFYVYPVIILIATIALGRGRPGRLLVSSLALAVVGAATVIASGGGIEIEALGVAFAFGSAITFSAYVLGAEHALRKTDPFTASLWVCIGATAGCATFAFISGNASLPPTATAWWNVAGMGVASGAAFICMLSGLRIVGAVRTSIISSLEPLAAAVMAYLLIGESVSPGTILGGALILAGAIGASLARPPGPPPTLEPLP